MLAGLKSIPLGAGDITDDIASTFGTRRAEAERIKCFYGSASTSPRDNHDMIELAPIAGGQDGVESARITRAELVAVIRRRLENLTGEIDEALKQLGFAGPLGRQVVLTGGGAELKGIADYAAGRARPHGPDRPPASCRACPRRIAARPSRPWPASPSSRRQRRARPAAPASAAGRGAGRQASGNVLQRLISAFRSGY